MPTLQRFADCRVVMYIDDHPPPHVHIFLRDGRDCTVDLETMQISGKVVVREVRDALAWMAKESAFLLNEWLRYNP